MSGQTFEEFVRQEISFILDQHEVYYPDLEDDLVQWVVETCYRDYPQRALLGIIDGRTRERINQIETDRIREVYYGHPIPDGPPLAFGVDWFPPVRETDDFDGAWHDQVAYGRSYVVIRPSKEDE